MHGARSLALATVATLALIGAQVSVTYAKVAAGGPASLTLSSAAAPQTGTVTLYGAGYRANEGVTIYFDQTAVALVGADPTGSFTYDYTIPAKTLSGQHWISAEGRASKTFAQAPLLVQTDWSALHNDAKRQGFQPYENDLSPSNVNQMDALWEYRAYYKVESSPAVVGGVVYIGSTDGNLYALNAVTGNKIWSFHAKYEYVDHLGNGIYSSPVVANGIVYFGDHNGRLYAINAATGKELWNYRTRGSVDSSPEVGNGYVYFGASDRSIYALNALTGKRKWIFVTGGPVNASPALDFKNHQSVCNDEHDADCHPDVVYEGSKDGNVYALDGVTGELIWKHKVGGAANSPTVAYGIVYVGSTNHTLSALTSSTGTPRWIDATNGAVNTTPAVADHVVYIGSDDKFEYALNSSNGNKIWSFGTGGVVRSSAAVANRVVYFGSSDTVLYAVSVAKGKELWRYTTDQAVTSSPAVANGTVFVGSKDYGVYAFDRPSGTPGFARPLRANLHSNRHLHLVRR